LIRHKRKTPQTFVFVIMGCFEMLCEILILMWIITMTTTMVVHAYPGEYLYNNNLCEFAFNHICDDGGINSTTALCMYGTDFSDCGPRPPYTRVPTSVYIRYTRSPAAITETPTFRPTHHKQKKMKKKQKKKKKKHQ
jgi:hypothetical protein